MEQTTIFNRSLDELPTNSRLRSDVIAGRNRIQGLSKRVTHLESVAWTWPGPGHAITLAKAEQELAEAIEDQHDLEDEAFCFLQPH